MEKMKCSWSEIKELVKLNEIDKIVEYCKKIGNDEYEIIEQKLIDELDNTKEINTRNTIAIVLSDLHSNKSINSIVSLIEKPENFNSRATLVYALQNLDCSDKIQQLFKLVFEGNYETKCNMYTLIESKMKFMKTADINYCINILKQKIEEYENNLELLYDMGENVFKLDMA